MEGITEQDIYKKSRILYIIEATLEYFIAMAFGEVYICRLTEYLGFNDSLTGILSAFVSLGCGFQLIAIFLQNKRPVKRWVTFLHVVNQLFFALIYLTPFLKISTEVKIVLFILFFYLLRLN